MPRIVIGLDVLVDNLPQTEHFIVTDDYIDLMGHMNVGYYGIFFANAAREMTHLLGVTLDYIDRERKGAFMLRQFTQFIAEAYLHDEMAIYTRVIARSDKRYQYMSFMVNKTQNRLAATMESLSTHADLELRRSAPFPPHLIANLDDYIARHNQLDWHDAPLSGILSP